MPENIVGPQIRHTRYQKGLTQNQLAAKCTILGFEITRGTLAKIEAQVRCVSDTELLILAKALSVGITDLYPPPSRR